MKKSTALALALAGLLLVACVTEDTTDPEVTVESPADGATLDTGAVTIKARATDDKEIEKVEFYDGTTKIGEDGTGTADTFDVSWTATAGTHTLKAKAYDKSDNTAEDAVTVTVTAGGGGGPTYHQGQIDTSETWKASGNPHIITGDVWVEDASNSPILTIEPGCIVKFQGDYELYCGYGAAGGIIADGTAAAPITFTSATVPPAPGNWECVSVYDYALSNTSFEYCTFEYAGSNTNLGSFFVRVAVPSFSNCTVKKSASAGIKLEGTGRFAQFTGNTIADCGGYAVTIEPEQARTLGTGNTYTGNTNNAILIDGGQVTTTGIWLNQGVPFVIGGDVGVEDAANTPVLTIAAGCSLKFNGSYELYCGYGAAGGIIADGTAAAPITFTSATVPPAPGNWECVSVYDYATANTNFEYCTFEYAGSNIYHGNFFVREAAPGFSNCTVRQSAVDGIKLEGTGRFAEFTGNTIADCGGYAVTIEPEQAKTLGSGNSYTGNTNNAISINSGTVTTDGTWLNQGVPYVIEGDVGVEDAANSPKLTIAAGTTVKLQPQVEFYVGYSDPGALVADGTAGQITFTSYVASPPPNDHWEAISFYDYATGASMLKNCKLEYGGHGDADGIIYIRNSLPTITGDSIVHSNYWGIYLDGTTYPPPSELQANNTFHDCPSGPVRIPPN